MKCRWAFWRRWTEPSDEARAACADADASGRQAAADFDRASVIRRIADEMTENMAEHNAANRFNEFLATRYGTQR